MKTYLLSLLSTALLISLAGILSPSGARDGIAKHFRLLSSLILITVLIAPLHGFRNGLSGLLDQLSGYEDNQDESNRDNTELEEVMDEASIRYFTECLTSLLEQTFSIPSGSVRVKLTWLREGEQLTPSHATVLLSGSAIWKDPSPIKAYVAELLGCEADVAIESNRAKEYARHTNKQNWRTRECPFGNHSRNREDAADCSGLPLRRR